MSIKKALWSTPTRADSTNVYQSQKALDAGWNPRLNEQVKLWPSPRAGNPGSRPNQKGGKILAEEVKKSLTFSPEASPVNPLVVPGSERARRTTVSSGLKCSALLKTLSPVGSLQRMLLESSEWHSTIVYLTWKVKATPRGRKLFQLAPSTPRTEGTGFGLWPTIDSSQRGTRAMDLVDNSSTLHRRGSGQKRGIDLQTAVKMWPTATGRDYKDTGDCENMPDNGLLGRVVQPSKKSGSLNPTWVEWLMGFPIGWTDLNRSETP